MTIADKKRWGGVKMADVDRAVNLLELREKWLEPFDVLDPFSGRAAGGVPVAEA